MSTSQVCVSSPFPLEKLEEEIKPQLQLFLSPYDHHSAASSTSLSNAPTSLNNPTQDHHKVDNYNRSVGGSSDHEVVRFDAGRHAAKKVFLCKREYGFDDNHELEMENMDGSKMIITSNCTNDDKPVKFQAPPHYVNYSFPSSISSSNNVRVCADCNTTTTPLWRSGPQGPKTLCNACGIRQRKARRAMGFAANGVVAEITSSSIKANKTSKEKKSHVSLLQCKPSDHNQSQKKLCLKNIALSLTSKKSTFQGMLPQDVEEAAVLLMELSCGFIHT